MRAKEGVSRVIGRSSLCHPGARALGKSAGGAFSARAGKLQLAPGESAEGVEPKDLQKRFPAGEIPRLRRCAAAPGMTRWPRWGAVWALVLAACLAAALALCACSGSGPDERPAGRVFDKVFTEQDVIDYLAEYREGSATTDDGAWGQWMASHGTDAEALRKEVVEYLAQNYLIERAASLRGVEVTDEEVTEAIDAQKQQYPSEMAWTRALINSGYTEDAYRMSVRSDLLKAAIKDTFADPATISDDDLEDYANSRMSGSTTRRSSAIFVANADEAGGATAAKAKAQQAREELLGGADFKAVFDKYSSTAYSETGDMGYDYYETPAIAYNRALVGLREVGAISDVVEADDGYFVIVLTDLFDGDAITGRIKLSKFPPELLDEFRVELARQQSNEAFDEFYTDNVSGAQVAVEPMPEGLPYDIPVPEEE